MEPEEEKLSALCIEILKELSKSNKVNVPGSYSFKAIRDAVKTSDKELDECLIKLDRDKYITEYPIGGHDITRVRLLQKGFDAAQDVD